jgi:hypothetical protein
MMMAASRSEFGVAARKLAAAGHPVLPLHTPSPFGCSCGSDCGSPGKHPRGVYGLSHATTNAEQVEAWWWGQPQANIGLRCDGLLVLDVDGPEGERSLVRLEAELGELPPTREQASGRGRHLLLSLPVDASIGNSTRPLGDPAGLDLRAGARGYIVAAPSRHASGARYRWTEPRAPAPLPRGWLERLRRPLRVVPPLPLELETAETTPYGRAALEDELCTILRARTGKRNETLNYSVFKLAQLVAEHRLARRELEESAFEIALLAGLTPFETRRTISSALEAGLRSPRQR